MGKQYDFDSVTGRRNTDSLKWNVAEHELPMWVADMDFQAAPEVREAMQKRLEHGVFGYSEIPAEWYLAYQNWWEARHHLTVKKNWLVFCTGVVPALSSCVRKLTTPGENVLVQTPVYNIFFNCIRNNGRNVLTSQLLLREEPSGDEEGAAEYSYEMDFADLEKKLSDPQTTLMILCNPQNPSGKIWEREALEQLGELCDRYHVTVISDEIHCDLTEPGTEYVPFASVSETCKRISISCFSASKAFNLAGLQSAAVMVPDKGLRHKVWRALNTDEVAEPNTFAAVSAIAALEEGGAWLDSLREYISENRRTVREYLNQNLPEVRLVKGDATYLLWLDAREVIKEGEDLAGHIRKKTGLYLSRGEAYEGPGFLRMNIACPRSVLEDGLERLVRGVKDYEQ